jgi:rhodanese-related sulfurtransferase
MEQESAAATQSARMTLMANAILYPELRRLLDAGAQLVDALPEAEYREEHLPGAISIPLKKLDAETTADLDKRKAVVVYCWDAL